MNCPKCGKELADLSGEYFCSDCGIEISDSGEAIQDKDNQPALEQKIDEKEFYEDVDGEKHGIVSDGNKELD